MIPILAQAAAETSSSSWIVIGVIALLSNLAVTILQFFRMSSGTDGQRQIEPTNIAEIKDELKEQTATLNKLDREMGEAKQQVASVARDVVEIKQVHRQEIEGVHLRIGGISRELTSTTTMVKGIQERENHKRPS
jgi:hypothetical protein